MPEKRSVTYHRERLREALREEIETILEGELRGLAAARGFIRHQLAERLRLRRPPELFFSLDKLHGHGDRIEQLLKRINKKK